MELRQLKYFATVAETLNFSAAAKSLCITQSTLSQQIKQLEEELDVQLFERSVRHVALTEAGEGFLPSAKNALYDAEVGVQRLNDLKKIRTGVLRIGVSYMFNSILAETVLQFTARYPKVQIKVFYGTVLQLKEMLVEGVIDFAMAYKPIDDDEAILSTPLFSTSLGVIVSPCHPLAHFKTLRLETLKKYPVALPTHGMQARSLLDHLLRQNKIELDAQLEINEVNMLLKMTRDGRYLTILSLLAAPKDNPKYVVIPLTESGNRLQASVLQLKGRYRKQSAWEFFKLLCDKAELQHRNLTEFV